MEMEHEHTGFFIFHFLVSEKKIKTVTIENNERQKESLFP